MLALPPLRLRRSLATASLVFASAGLLHAQSPELGLISASDAGSGDGFATTVARDGDLLVVGAPGYDLSGFNEGAAYVFRFDGAAWVEEAILTASDGANSDAFGSVLAVRGDLIVVGVPDHDGGGTTAGAAYVFRHDGTSWNEEQKLEASDGVAFDRFGDSVAVDGSDLLVGASAENAAAPGAGSVYAFRYRGSALGWLEDQKFQRNAALASDGFGTRMLLHQGTLFVSAPLADTQGTVNSGAVCLFQRSSDWQEVGELQTTDPGVNDRFGQSLAVDGSTFFVGSPLDDDSLLDVGSVTVFQGAGANWTEVQKLWAASPQDRGNFGSSVALDGDRALVGVPFADGGAVNDGYALSFRRRGGVWAEDQPLGVAAGQSSDHAGTSVALRGSQGLVGGPNLDSPGLSNNGALAIHVVGDFVLDLRPAQPLPGDLLELESYNGHPASTIILVLREVNGSTVFNVLLNFRFNANHRLSLSAPTPPGLAGVSLGFQTFKFGAFDEIQASNIARIDLQ